MTAQNIQTNLNLLDQAVKCLVEVFNPQRVYLFGSRARGDAFKDSDYDILVVVAQSDQPRYRRAQEAYRSLVGVRIPLEVMVLTQSEF